MDTALHHLSEVAVSVELETEDMTLNIGPQHPSTHGVLRLIAKVAGERARVVELPSQRTEAVHGHHVDEGSDRRHDQSNDAEALTIKRSALECL